MRAKQASPTQRLLALGKRIMQSMILAPHFVCNVPPVLDTYPTAATEVSPERATVEVKIN